MALNGGWLFLVFLGCSIFSCTYAQGNVDQTWTVSYNIKAGDPDKVLNQTNEVIAAVKMLTDQVLALSNNLTYYNNTDLSTLQGILDEIIVLNSTIATIEDQYNDIQTKSQAALMELQDLNSTLQCFAATTCVTGAPTTPYTGPTTTTHLSCIPSSGTIFPADSTQQRFTSQNFPQDMHGLACNWIVRAPPGQYVEIIVQEVSFAAGSAGSFSILDATNNASWFSTTTNTNSNTTVRLNDTSPAAVYFNVASQGTSGKFNILYTAFTVDPCVGVTCKNGGTCKPNGNVPECKCAPCFHGPHCEDAIDNPCLDPPYTTACEHGGHCEIDPATCSNPHCVCTGGYTGPFCTSTPPPPFEAFHYYKLYDRPDIEG